MVQIDSSPGTIRQGDVAQLVGTVTDAAGAQSPISISWRVSPSTNGFVDDDGRFVGYLAGAVRVIAEAGGDADSVTIDVTGRGLSGSFSPAGRGLVPERLTSDLWLFGDFGYTGSWGQHPLTGASGNALYAWDLRDPLNPIRTDSVIVSALTVNDVKIRSDGSIAVLSHESDPSGQNGVTLLDLADPLHPTFLARVTATLGNGVHNLWIEGDYIYAVVDGTGLADGLRILDISDLSNIRVAASFYAGSSFLHDVYVRDGLAFLSHWNAGLVILDVGNGIVGGSPDNPVEVSRIEPETRSGVGSAQVHNAWYWPEEGYVFIGEEDFSTPGIGYVLDVTDLRAPRQVATFAVEGSPPHNFWLDEEASVLYVGWYTQGLRALDVSGTLLGALEEQGREIASIRYDGPGSCGAANGTCSWAPQLHGDHLFVADLNSGLWVFSRDF